MYHISEILTRKLSEHLSAGFARLDCLSQLVLGMLSCERVKLSSLALRMRGDAKPASNYRRLQRFFLGFRFDTAELARLLLFMLRCTLEGNGQKHWLMMDRTNWKFGKTDHNLLVISIQKGDTAVPLLWRSLGKAGNSSMGERIALMERLLRFFPKERIAGLLADREFIGETWLGWLQAQGIPFVTRLKGNLVARPENGGTIPLGKLFAWVPEGCASKPCRVTLGENLCMKVQAKRTGKGLVIVAFDGELPDNAPQPVNLYRKRWLIECGFACLKRKGFELEDTHLIHAERLETLLGVVAIAFAWSLSIGCNQPKPIRKNHGYLANCRFTLGKNTIIAALQYAKNITKLITFQFNQNYVKHNVV